MNEDLKDGRRTASLFWSHGLSHNHYPVLTIAVKNLKVAVIIANPFTQQYLSNFTPAFRVISIFLFNYKRIHNLHLF